MSSEVEGIRISRFVVFVTVYIYVLLNVSICTELQKTADDKTVVGMFEEFMFLRKVTYLCLMLFVKMASPM